MPENIQFELDKLTNNPNYVVRIVLGVGAGGKGLGTVKGYLRQEFAVGSTADYSSPFESSTMDNAQNIITSVASAVDMTTGSNLSSFRLSNILGSVAIWRSTKKPQFQISMVFVAIRPDDDVTKNIRLLMRAIYPSAKGLLLEGPLGYAVPQVNIKGATKGKGATPSLASAKGTSVISIGKWFSAPGQLITNVNFSLSKEVTSAGRPLYATAEVSFEPWRILVQDEINSFFRI